MQPAREERGLIARTNYVDGRDQGNLLRATHHSSIAASGGAGMPSLGFTCASHSAHRRVRADLSAVQSGAVTPTKEPTAGS